MLDEAYPFLLVKQRNSNMADAVWSVSERKKIISDPGVFKMLKDKFANNLPVIVGKNETHTTFYGLDGKVIIPASRIELYRGYSSNTDQVLAIKKDGLWSIYSIKRNKLLYRPGEIEAIEQPEEGGRVMLSPARKELV
jgi:hypothetical protein